MKLGEASTDPLADEKLAICGSFGVAGRSSEGAPRSGDSLILLGKLSAELSYIVVAVDTATYIRRTDIILYRMSLF